MPKVAIYCRLSIEDKDKSDNDASASIQNQKAMLRDYCHERDWEIYDIYVDDGYSGIDRSRPEFNRMLRDCEKGYINIVLCKDQSRFSRDTVIVEKYINDKFLEWGIRFIGVADNADTDSESYSTMRLFTSAYNEMYVKDISAKIRRTLAYKREQGQFIASFAPYGYMIDAEDKHHLVIDEETASVVRQIFDMYISGAGYRAIVLKLNSDGIVSPTEYKRLKGSKYVNLNADTSNSRGLWTQSTVARILANEMYTGTLVQGKSHHISYKNKKRKKVEQADWIRIPNTHEAIIDAETWARTQARLRSNGRVGKRSQELSPLSGKVKCAVCGRPMKRNVYYNKAKTIKYYGLQCATYKTGAMNCTNKKSISGLVLEKKILDELNSIVEQYCQADTGTPIENKDHSTSNVFGDIIDVYDMTQAIDDGATVPITYEARMAKVGLNDKILQEIDAYYDTIENEGLQESDSLISEFDDELWLTLVEKAILMQGKKITFILKDGSKISLKIPPREDCE